MGGIAASGIVNMELAVQLLSLAQPDPPSSSCGVIARLNTWLSPTITEDTRLNDNACKTSVTIL